MTNQEMILAYNGIMQFQNMEQKKFEESGKKILSGKIQLAFSINKNKAAIVQAYYYVQRQNWQFSFRRRFYGHIRVHVFDGRLWRTNSNILFWNC